MESEFTFENAHEWHNKPICICFGEKEIVGICACYSSLHRNTIAVYIKPPNSVNKTDVHWLFCKNHKSMRLNLENKDYIILNSIYLSHSFSILKKRCTKCNISWLNFTYKPIFCDAQIIKNITK